MYCSYDGEEFWLAKSILCFNHSLSNPSRMYSVNNG